MVSKEKIEAINKVVETYFEESKDIDKVFAKNLMPKFIEAGVFEKDYQKGLPIRTLLQSLEREKNMHLIPTLSGEKKNIITNWYFIRKK